MELLVVVFIAGYILIAFERKLRVEKSAIALILGISLWVLVALMEGGHGASEALAAGIGDIAGIVFFLLGAMTIVEVIDRHDGFSFISSRIKTRNSIAIVWILSFLAFSLSAILDNLTTTIVMITLARKLVVSREDRMMLAGMIVIAANAGGAFSPIGDVTTTMLWIGGQISAPVIIRRLFFPALISLVIPLIAATVVLVLGRSRGAGETAPVAEVVSDTSEKPANAETTFVFLLGVALLVAVPVFKILTGLPPWLGILGALGILWLATDILHRGKEASQRTLLSPTQAFTRIDLPSLVFFIGILLAISALEHGELLHRLAEILSHRFPDQRLVMFILGIFSSIVDNVPLVAGAMGMFSLATYPMDHVLWESLAFCAGTGGSLLIIGSAPGVVAMGLEGLSFGWYLKRIAPMALLGYLAGVATLFLS
jgi:Na+/H+ antiporter NhaD/arsenite permease-like protein